MSDTVCFNQDSLIKVDDKLIKEIKEKAKSGDSGRYRLCLQHSAQDCLHEMFIVRSRDDYGRPDMHLHTTESHTIVEGVMWVILFEENGEIREAFELSDKGYRTYRIDTGIYHMQIPVSDQVVYYEVKLGPFTQETNIFPEWAPQADDKENVDRYMKDLRKRVQEIIEKGEIR